MSATNEKGYRMVRCSLGCDEGSWYYEVSVLHNKGNSRFGWSTVKGDVQAPVGFDEHSYSYRDKDGHCFHQSRGKQYGAGYGRLFVCSLPHLLIFSSVMHYLLGPGDVIGFYIYLPPKESVNKDMANESKDDIKMNDLTTSVAVAGVSVSNNVSDDNNNTNGLVENASTSSEKKESPLTKRLGSRIQFFKNGVNQGDAFVDINDGTYYAAASFYMGAGATFNFGPLFKYPPPKELNARPLCELEDLLPPPAPVLVNEEATMASIAPVAATTAPNTADESSKHQPITTGAAAAVSSAINSTVVVDSNSSTISNVLDNVGDMTTKNSNDVPMNDAK
jgi:hypothetical protein